MAGPGDECDEAISYSERPEWADVEPVPQDDGPQPLAVIRYPQGFVEAHNYFRAIQQRNEFSERALALTTDIIGHNSANYTAWYYRRRCLKALKADLNRELNYTDKWARDSPKNYQVWYHRRWLITEIADEYRSQEGATPEEIETKVQELAERELSYHQDVMQVNDDFKNYNGWSHRLFIADKFGAWGDELAFVDDLLRDDIRNNSAWNHRHTVVRKTCIPITDEVRQREIDYTIRALRRCANNESAWNYLAAYFGTGEGQTLWNSVPAVEQLCQEVIAVAGSQEATWQNGRFALETLARINEEKGNASEALRHYETLKGLDKIRANYWDWRAAVLAQEVKLE
mmetsp:Transcript_9962/g.26385  ORF Transcript_9962/g.26385 Transcript_9962/m.26385 type:complete len:343 (-) Transcript_9962:120-1148(-)